MNPFRLDGKLALVTGAGRGIGMAVARAMAEAGADVILAARSCSELEAAADGLRRDGFRAHARPLDLRETGAIPGWYDETVGRIGHPDILVNAAGVTLRGPAESFTMAQWDETIAFNLTAVFAVCQAFARHCIAAGAAGNIVNIASLMTAAARRNTAAYAASKGGIGQLTKGLAVDWADKGIRVNAIAPGYVKTRLTQPLWENPEFDSWVLKRTPLARWAAPEDIALPAGFLASPAAAFITGHILFVDGGWMATF